MFNLTNALFASNVKRIFEEKLIEAQPQMATGAIINIWLEKLNAKKG